MSFESDMDSDLDTDLDEGELHAYLGSIQTGRVGVNLAA